jgi:hypothetical protein
MNMRKTANRDRNVRSLEVDVAMDFCFLTLKTVSDQSGNKNTHFWPTKTGTNKTPGSSDPWMMNVVK